MSGAWRLAAAATYALLALLWFWTWETGGPGSFPPWAVAAMFSLPLLPPALAFVLRRPRAPLWAGIAALLYFCHGVAAYRVGDGAWSVAEIALSVLIIFAAGWPGIAAKLAKRRAATRPNV